MTIQIPVWELSDDFTDLGHGRHTVKGRTNTWEECWYLHIFREAVPTQQQQFD